MAPGPEADQAVPVCGAPVSPGVRRGAGVALGGVIAAVLLATSCGGSPTGPGVARAGPGTVVTTPASNHTCAGNCRLDHLLGYARCMRSHGFPDFADPVPAIGPNGKKGWSVGYSGDPNAPVYVAADNACEHNLIGGGVSPPLTAAQQHAWLAWAACVRGHGFPSFPDPSFAGGSVMVPSLAAGDRAKAGAAQKACAPYLSAT